MACLTAGCHCEGLQVVSFLHDDGLRREILRKGQKGRAVKTDGAGGRDLKILLFSAPGSQVSEGMPESCSQANAFDVPQRRAALMR
jgi:hypothetical protein